MKAQVMKLAHSIAKTMTGKYATRLSVALKTAWAQLKGDVSELSQEAVSFVLKNLGIPSHAPQLSKAVEAIKAIAKSEHFKVLPLGLSWANAESCDTVELYVCDVLGW